MIMVKSPGKIILTGEHSVLYGASAYALAVQQHVCTYFITNDNNYISFRFHKNGKKNKFTPNSIRNIAKKLEKKMLEFEKGKIDISELCPNPDNLIAYTIDFISKRGNLLKNISGELSSVATIPIGSGMGYSAAIISSVIMLFEYILELELEIDQRIIAVRKCEKLIHGNASLIDAATVNYGGIVRVNGEKIEAMDLTLRRNWYYIFTGKPLSTTGQCVDYVKIHHGKSTIWNDFIQISDALMSSLTNEHDLISSLRTSHRLLCQIGVVPTRVADLILDIERSGGAAKISGAGSISGDCAGIVIAYLKDGSIETICEKYGLYIKNIKGDFVGTRIQHHSGESTW